MEETYLYTCLFSERCEIFCIQRNVGMIFLVQQAFRARKLDESFL